MALFEHHNDDDEFRWLGFFSRLLSIVLILAVLLAALLIVQPARADTEQIYQCQAQGGVWQKGKCEYHPSEPGLFSDPFSLAIIIALGLTAAGAFSGSDKDKPAAKARPR